MFSDGCTSLAWSSPSQNFSYLAQNWDWMDAQKPNLIRLTITQNQLPVIKIVTEAGIIGKIGLNSAGVGICFNAIRAKGMDVERLASHLGLRMALECWNREEAVRKLEAGGIASSCYMCIADGESGGVGLEWSHIGLRKIGGTNGRVCHANHYVLEHPGVEDTNWIRDSAFRQARIEELCENLETVEEKDQAGADPTLEDIIALFRDEKNYPGSISRKATADTDHSSTLFNIVMDLRAKKAFVRVGRPSEPAEEVFELGF
jgi:isopenicillin-N N-acyltransferase like protein